MPCYVGAGTRMDAPSAASQTDSLQWHAFCCNDRPCLILTSARRPHHKATPFGQPMFLSSTPEPFLCPNLPDTTAPRTEVVKTGRRPPPQAAQRGLDGREHGAKLDQIGSADASPRTPRGAATKFTQADTCGLTAPLIFNPRHSAAAAAAHIPAGASIHIVLPRRGSGRAPHGRARRRLRRLR